MRGTQMMNMMGMGRGMMVTGRAESLGRLGGEVTSLSLISTPNRCPPQTHVPSRPCAAYTGVPGGMQPGRFMGEMVELAIFRRANESIAQAARETMEVCPVAAGGGGGTGRWGTLQARRARAPPPPRCGIRCCLLHCSGLASAHGTLRLFLHTGADTLLPAPLHGARHLQARQLLGSGLPQVDESILKAAKAGLFINLLAGGGLSWPGLPQGAQAAASAGCAWCWRRMRHQCLCSESVSADAHPTLLSRHPVQA